MNQQTLSKALQQLDADGFVTVPMHYEASQAIDVTLALALNFFRLPRQEKDVSKLSLDCGYRPMGVEYSQSSDQPDAIESFTACIKTAGEASALPVSEAVTLHRQMIFAMDQLESTVEALTIHLAECISGRAFHSLLGGAIHFWSRIQINYSCPRETTSAFINDVHEDGHLFTLTCATSRGLEVKTKSGAFADLLATPSQPVILPGEIAYLLSGGRINPLYHRVRPDRGCNERVSLQYFCDIDPGACEPWACTDINRNVDIGALILTNPARFGLSGWSST